MGRCTCKTIKGTQCKNDATVGTKTCSIHKKCKSRVSKASSKKASKSKVSKARKPKAVAVKWHKSAAWETPVPLWMRGGEKVKTKPLSPKKKTPEPWWLE